MNKMIKNKTKITLKNKTEGIYNFMDYKKTSTKIIYAVLVLILVIVSLICLFPVIWVFLSSFKTPTEFFSKEFTLFPNKIDFSKITVLWQELELLKYYKNSLILVFGSVICSVLFNGLMAYSVSILKPKGYQIVYALIMMTMMVPAVTNMYPLLQNFVKFEDITGIKMFGSYLPLCLAYGANAFYFTLFKTNFDRLPKEVFEAATIDGCNKMQMFFKIVLPLSVPIMVVVAIFTVNAAWSDFLLPYLVLMGNTDMKTIMIRIYDLQVAPPQGFTQDKLFMLISLSIIPVIIIFSIFQRQITSAQTGTGKD